MGHPADKEVALVLDDLLDPGYINETKFRPNVKIAFLTTDKNAQQLLNSILEALGSAGD